jgi:hypothetical protein
MAKRIPGPYDEKVLPILAADKKLRSSLYDVRERLRILQDSVGPHFILGYYSRADDQLIELERELRAAADAIANWKAVSAGMSSDEYYKLYSENEAVRRGEKKARERARAGT